MATHLRLPNGNLIAPSLIKGVIKFPAKGVALRNEFNKIVDFIQEPDIRRQAVIMRVLGNVLSRRDWVQPDWDAELAEVQPADEQQ